METLIPSAVPQVLDGALRHDDAAAISAPSTLEPAYEIGMQFSEFLLEAVFAEPFSS